ncbi:MAG: hypothetical protein H0X02_07525 [Nitrosomonas sp.]|nr:hypothetical protein [Nitrosomonas sp.]
MKIIPEIDEIIATQPQADGGTLTSLCLDVISLGHKNFFNSVQAFAATQHLKNLDPVLRSLFMQGAYEKAFYLHGDACGIRCLKCHPLYQAMRSGSEAEISCLLFVARHVLVNDCYCVTDWQIAAALHYVLLEYPTLKTKYPQFKSTWELADQYTNNPSIVAADRKKQLETTIHNYYANKNGVTIEMVIDLIKKAPLTDEEINNVANCYAPPGQGSYIDHSRKVLALLPFICQTDRAKLIDSYRQDNSIFKPYMTQDQKNRNLLTAIMRWNSRTVEDVRKLLEVGGDVYSTDCQGNPWMACILANVCWSNKFPRPKDGMQLHVMCRDDLGREIYLLAKRYDRWRFETHRNRPSGFKTITLNLLLCIQRVVGGSLPYLCTELIMQHLTIADAKIKASVVDSDDILKSYKLELAALYLNTYGESVLKLLIVRGIKSNGSKDIHVASSKLADDTYLSLNRLPGGVCFAMSQLYDAILNVERRKMDNLKIQAELGSRGLDVYRKVRNDHARTPAERIAFHDMFGYDSPLLSKSMVLESPNKKLKQ